MAKRVVVALDEKTTEKYFEMASKATEAEVNAGCEPSGVSLNIDIGGGLDKHTVWIGDEEIGEAAVSFEGEQWL